MKKRVIILKNKIFIKQDKIKWIYKKINDIITAKRIKNIISKIYHRHKISLLLHLYCEIGNCETTITANGHCANCKRGFGTLVSQKMQATFEKRN